MVRSLVLDHTDHTITYSGRWIVFPAVHLTGEQNASATFDFNGRFTALYTFARMINFLPQVPPCPSLGP